MGYDTLACFIACLCFSIAAWLCLSMRAYVRIHLLRGPFLDDVLALIGAVLFTAMAVLFMINSWFVANEKKPTPEARMTVAKIGFSIDMLYLVGTFTMKLSFARTLSRIIQTHTQAIVLYMTIMAGAIITIAVIIQGFLYCQPFSYMWKQILGSASSHCHARWTRITASLVQAAWVVVADVVLGLIIPCILLRGCRMNLGTRISVHVLLGLGSIAGIATVIRMPYAAIGIGVDSNKNALAIRFWEITELAINIICTSAATWRPLFYKPIQPEPVPLEEQTCRNSLSDGVVEHGWPPDC
ncbi:hypothetical protein BJY01DRAFT_128446 [Aspergillus pseudoustus]|uniref:Rhodopsin domain-containing protein n=1 Tax=Aspergillus pseudoustus TaxID=1810923 RepID=A0ABR4IMD1_9EURO